MARSDMKMAIARLNNTDARKRSQRKRNKGGGGKKKTSRPGQLSKSGGFRTYE